MYPIKIIVTSTSVCLRSVLENYIIKEYFKIYNNEIDGHMTEFSLPLHAPALSSANIRSDQKVSVHLTITVQKRRKYTVV